jgi:membrane protein DedA with SNARE-associated domain
VTQFVTNYGTWVVVVLVFAESLGVPFAPGETAFVIAAALAGGGHGSIATIILGTIAAAVLGAFAGYLVGRSFGARLTSRFPRLGRTEGLFRRHGAKALYFGRFIPLIRATLGPMAGVIGMPLPKFLGWTVAGCASWGCAIGIASYYLGTEVEHDVTIGVAIVVAFALGLVGLHVLRHRVERA